jgi:hypothetical protein
VSAETRDITYDVIGSPVGTPVTCWITRNLGAANQPTVNSANAASYNGWYFLYNNKQGHYYNSSTITPAFPTIAGLTANTNWLAANDPCTLLLGTAWHVGTYSEWNSAISNFGLATNTGSKFSTLYLACSGVMQSGSTAALAPTTGWWYTGTLKSNNLVYGVTAQSNGTNVYMSDQPAGSATINLLPVRCAMTK